MRWCDVEVGNWFCFVERPRFYLFFIFFGPASCECVLGLLIRWLIGWLVWLAGRPVFFWLVGLISWPGSRFLVGWSVSLVGGLGGRSVGLLVG